METCYQHSNLETGRRYLASSIETLQTESRDLSWKVWAPVRAVARWLGLARVHRDCNGGNFVWVAAEDGGVCVGRDRLRDDPVEAAASVAADVTSGDAASACVDSERWLVLSVLALPLAVVERGDVAVDAEELDVHEHDVDVVARLLENLERSVTVVGRVKNCVPHERQNLRRALADQLNVVDQHHILPAVAAAEPRKTVQLPLQRVRRVRNYVVALVLRALLVHQVGASALRVAARQRRRSLRHQAVRLLRQGAAAAAAFHKARRCRRLMGGRLI
mmetsp:Transcript_54382/g.118576  ORF Transcript_54382/g.118576 Transcript_54382/m.118576 type:complete len:276 (-) Transcript_54382:486-1313(-)|eukprot:4518813-Pleurochrysis_carterae.AAC.5